MKFAWVPFAAIGLLILAQVSAFRNGPSQTAQTVDPGATYFWLEVYTATLPPSTLSVGEHTYQYNFAYTAPAPGALNGGLHTIQVSDQAAPFRGYALLRPGGIQVLDTTPNPPACKVIDRVNPGQEIKFMVAWVPDLHMTEAEFVQQISSMTATVRWDGGQPVKLSPQLTTVSWEPLWNCLPWVDLLHKNPQPSTAAFKE